MSQTVIHPAATLEKLNPANETPLPTVPVATSEDVQRALERAKALFKSVNSTASACPRHRRQIAQVLKTVSRQLLRRSAFWSDLLAQEVGKPAFEAIGGDVMTATSWLDYCAKHGPSLLDEKPIIARMAQVLGRRIHTRRAPFGVAAVITPWNYPLGISVSGISTALMGGNAVVFKPSELTPGVGEAVASLFREALVEHSLSPDWVQCLQGDGHVGAMLTHHPEVDIAVFTGSEVTGRNVQAALQARGKTAILELGGNDAMLVLPDVAPTEAQIDTLASTAVWGRCVNAGQTCCAVKRLWVHRSLAQPLIESIADKMNRIVVGSPDDAASQMGPLISRAALKKITEQVQDAIDLGAKVLAGGYPLDGPGYFYPPTLLVDVAEAARVLNEEVFAPVLPVIVYQDIDTTIELINKTNLGLSASIFGPVAQAKDLACRINSGTISINGLPHMNFGLPQIPWVSWGRSGPGVSHSEAGLLALTQPQIITTEETAQKQSWFYLAKPQKDGAALALAMAQCMGAASFAGKLKALPEVVFRVLKNKLTPKL
ncbi:MAG: aldehyde dehydrogenase family protein [Vampirovibrionales bacterium]|nr:aldehyde dehydrogenase family protein [Vampirovibrionales bacterium]